VVETNDLILVGTLLAVPACIYAAVALTPRHDQPAKYAVTIEATVGGTTDPTPNTYEFDAETTVTVLALVTNPQYVFEGWYLDGHLESVEPSFTFTIRGNHLLIAAFYNPEEPPVIPALIKPIQNCSATHWWKVEKLWKGALIGDVLQIFQDFKTAGFVKFKIQDDVGNGVPGQKLAVYTDLMPDPTDYGSLLLEGAVRTISDPLILTSNSEGVIAVKCEYEWYEHGCPTEGAYCYKNTLGQGGRIMIKRIWTNWHGPPVWHDLHFSPPANIIYWDRLRNPLYRNFNPVHCYWVDNPNLTVLGDATADCMVKLEESKNL